MFGRTTARRPATTALATDGWADDLILSRGGFGARLPWKGEVFVHNRLSVRPSDGNDIEIAIAVEVGETGTIVVFQTSIDDDRRPAAPLAEVLEYEDAALIRVYG